MEIHRIDDIVNQIRAAARVLQLQTGKSYLILANYLAKELKSAYRGPEKFGLDLPMVFLAAIQRSMVPEASRLKKQSRQNVVAVTKSENTANSNDNPSVFRASLLKADDSYHPFDDFMTIVVSPDKLAASISVFDPKFFTSKLENSRENWDQLLAKKKLVSFSDELKNIMQMVTNKASLQNAVIAKGRVPVLGQEPYLVKVDPQSATGEELSDPAAMRERQQRVFVKKGQPVAVIAFAKPAVVGVDVFGKEIPGAAANLDRIAIGEGVEVKGNYFVASLDGVPTVQASSVSLSRALIIPTSVNMATGNVRFDGPVEIKGSVEEGATVDVNGDLVVRGMILGGTVKASGNILVEGGITTNDRGLIMCGKSLSANFIAQTRVICKNDVSVEKNILNSVVHAAGRIVVTAPESVVSGGEISCEKELICANLGRESGVVTSVRVGCDTKHEKIVTKIKSRLEKIQQAMKSIRNSQAYRDKADATLSTRQLKEKEKFSSQAERGQRILQKLETRLAGATAQVTLNTKARVVVNQVLSKNCNIVIGGKIIPVRNEMAGVELLGEKLRSGEYFKAIEEVAS